MGGWLTDIVDGSFVLEGIVQVDDKRVLGDLKDQSFTLYVFLMPLFSDLVLHDSFHCVEGRLIALFSA